WLDFTAEMERIRIVKSAEEIAFLERSAQIVDAAYQVAVAHVRPGVMDYEVWGATIEAICSLGSELPVHLPWIGDHRPVRALTRPTFRNVQEGWLFLTAIEAAWGGYRARGAQPFACGQPNRAYHELAAFLADLWNET